MKRRFELTDEEWARLAPCCFSPSPGGARTYEENGYAEVAFTRFTLHQLTG
jgi:hypothetical protein